MKETLKPILTLFIISAISGVLLGFVYSNVEKKIEIQDKKKMEEAINYVLNTDTIKKEVTKTGEEYWAGYDNNNNLISIAYLCEGKGYSSTIRTIAGMDLDGNILGIRILFQQETPGLGARSEEIKSDRTIWQIFNKNEEKTENPWFQEQFTGKNIMGLKLVKGKSNKNEVSAITGATITSTAITKSVIKYGKNILKAIKNNG